MSAKVRTWVWVVVGIAVVGILGIIAMAGVGLYFFSQNIETRAASPSVAARSFDDVLKQFDGQKPLIELDTNGHFKKANTDRQAPPQARAPESLHVMAFDSTDGQIVNVKIPFWLLRLKTGGATIDFNGSRMDLEDLKLSVDDLERFGPTLIVDHRNEDGDRVLVWSQ